MRKISHTVYLIVIVLFTQCQDLHNELEINPNLKVKFIVSHYENSPKVYAYGWVNVNNEKVGRWSYFDKNGRLKQTFEYKIINGKRHNNQGWVYRESINDTNWDRSIFYKINGLKPVYHLGDSLRVKISVTKMLKDWSTIFYYGDNINNDFSNLENVKLDSFVTKDTFAYLTKPFLKKGWNNFRIIIEQFSTGYINDSLAKAIRRMYIDKKYYVNQKN